MPDTPFIGEIMPFAGTFAPTGWAACNGQLMPISGNEALFALIGTTYGGDGVSTFALPDLRGRVPNHTGQGPGLSNYVQGQVGGTEAVTLTAAQMPAHTHTLAEAAVGTAPVPNGRVPAPSRAADLSYGPQTSPPGTMVSTVVGAVGGNQPHQNTQPTLAINFCIALQGVFPSRP
jgi:microcystin-dependent protein